MATSFGGGLLFRDEECKGDEGIVMKHSQSQKNRGNEKETR